MPSSAPGWMVVRIWARRWVALQSSSMKPVQAGTSSYDAKATAATADDASPGPSITSWRSEEHTSELQSRGHLVCRLLLEKKKTRTNNNKPKQSEIRGTA